MRESELVNVGNERKENKAKVDNQIRNDGIIICSVERIVDNKHQDTDN